MSDQGVSGESTGPGLRYYPVTAGDEVIGYLYASEADDWASFIRRMAARFDTSRAAVEWSKRLDQAGNYGFSPLQALRHWVGRPVDPEAGGIAAGAEEQRAPDMAALERLANPELARTPPPTPSTPPAIGEGGTPHSGDRSIDWAGYGFMTGGTVRYLPVTRGGEVLGFLWASETDHAADYLPRTAAGVDGVNAGELWMSRLDQSQVDGLTPVQALRRWVGEREDPRAGGIAADAVERVASSLEVLTELAQSCDEKGEA